MVTHFEMEMREMLREMEYYRKLVKEQEGIIAQLHRGFPKPGQPVYIHPADFVELLEELKPEQCYTASVGDLLTRQHTVANIHYVQTPAMPKITTKFN